jgi:hypothetical protein
MRWSTGEAAVERLLAAGHVERVQGAQADGASWLDRARRGLQAARVIAETAPDSSVILAYDAARQACVALLARRACAPPPQAATTQSRKSSELSSGRL